MSIAGVAWPTTWRRAPLWSMFRRVKDVGHPEEEMLSVYREYGVVRKESREDNFNKTAENRNIYQLVDDGWLIVNRMKAWQGSLGISPYRGIVSGHYICFEPTHHEDSRFLNYLLRSSVYQVTLHQMSRGVRPNQIEIDNDELRALPVHLPGLAEQRAIADYLDAETTRIDVLIAKKQQLIYLLEERWRVAAETTMNELGAAFGWAPLKRFIKCLDCRRVPLSGEDRSLRQGEFPYYGASGVIDHVDDYLFDETLVLLGEDGAQLADPDYEISFVVSGRIWVNNHAHVLRPIGSDPHFLALHLSTLDRGSFISGATREKITQDDMSRIPVPTCPLNEQRQAAQRIRQVRAECDRLIGRLQRQIDLLAEHRQALVTALVTGKAIAPTAA